MAWIVFLIISTAAAITNPHVGIMGVYYLIELVIFIGIKVYLNNYGKIVSKTDGNEIIVKKYNRILSAWSLMSVISFVAGTLLISITWLKASGVGNENNVILTPIDVFSRYDRTNVSIVLLILTVAFSLIATFLLIRDKNIMQEVIKDNKADVELSKLVFPIDVLTLISVVAATVVGCFNNYFGYLSFLIHLFYFIVIAMIVILMSNYNKTYNNANAKSYKSDFFKGMVKGGKYNNVYAALIWLITVCNINLQVLMAYKFEYDSFGFLSLANSKAIVVCSILMDIIMSLFLSSSIRQIHGK